MWRVFEVWLTIGFYGLLIVSGQGDDRGGWADWSEPSVCSRTCGGGVKYQERWCISDDPADCSGPTKIYSSCNIQDCPPGTADFRAEQCAQYNQVAYKDKYYEWLPYYGGANKCSLSCLAKGEQFYFQHAAQVTDGTSCDRDSTDVCVEGVCQTVGCDRLLGSNAVFDKCHVCGGNGSSCRTLTGFVDPDTLSHGYNDILLIPSGATSLSFREEYASGNYLAIRSQTGEYFLNGNWMIELTQSKTIAGTSFVYERGSETAAQGAEYLSAEGPIDQPLFVSVIKQRGKSPRIYYEYSLPLEVNEGSAIESYSWKSEPWSQCTASCATGQQTRQVNCLQNSDGSQVPGELCNQDNKPQEKEDCNTKPCPAHWHIGTWEPCTTSCGEGVQVRTVFCQQRIEEDLHTIVDSKLCPEGKPTVIQSCNAHVECPKWEVEEWSKCNRVCGAGKQIRRVVCQAQHPLPDAISDLLADSQCDSASKPEDEKACFIQPCEGLEWIVSQWSGCQGSCAEGYETRQVVCSNKHGKVHKDEECDPSKVPQTQRQCVQDRDSCDAGPRWHASQWEQCSARCGPGIKSRQVVCAQREAYVLTVLDDSHCDLRYKMEAYEECVGTDCQGVWFSGPWGKCSQPCGTGERARKLLCFWLGKAASPDRCNSQDTPFSVEACNTGACNEDDLLPVGGCQASEFRCCPDGFTAAEGENYLGCPSGDRIPVGICVESEFGCCLDGTTPAQGPFLAACPKYTCLNSVFGCCTSDGETPAGGLNQEDCPEEYSCHVTAFGCCPDEKTPALGIHNKGCPPLCLSSRYGCCTDGLTMALGENNEGCEDFEGSGEDCESGGEGCNMLPVSCNKSLYGCCPDGVSAANGPKLSGCEGVIVEPESGCGSTKYGCCPDKKTPALGDRNEGCDSNEVEATDCMKTFYGCCPDLVSFAQGPDFQGCPELPVVGGCAGTRFGCCPGSDEYALGDNFEGCDTVVPAGCETSLYGCCMDGKSFAQGYQYEGCSDVTEKPHSCDYTTFGCCPDGVSVATGPEFHGCQDEGYAYTCSDTPFGCCPDGESIAQGPKDAGCPSRLKKGGICGMWKERGACSNFIVKWYYDTTVGDCSRFWYGGCGGNENRFDSKQECNQTCITPEVDSLDVCYLPKVIGRCKKTETRFYYNPETASCEKFAYGGCRGNANNFKAAEKCEQRCVIPQRPDVCSQPFSTGPCRGSFMRWFFDKSSGVCREFTYGGCKGNDNRFESKDQCEQRCTQPATTICQLPKHTGHCRADYPMWYFNADIKQCEQFTYGGCGGNHNRFGSQAECKKSCHELITKKVINICQLPREPGPCKEYYERWHYNRTSGYCEQFVYGGCRGNENQFVTEEDCRDTCSALEPIDLCTLPSYPGTCSQNLLQFYFDSGSGDCKEFIYSGCDSNGNNFDTMEECNKACHHLVKPAITNKCQLEPDTGPCIKNIPRWYYNATGERCEEFVYGGCNGNRNRFMTKDQCETDCDSVQPPVTESPVTTTQADKGMCTLREDSGTCYDYYPMWYYDNRLNRCLQFVYTGCGGNSNRYPTRLDCEAKCVEKEPEVLGLEVCALPSKRGSCVDEIDRWYYDTEKGRCLPFTFSGCHGNINNFASEDECKNTCPVEEICALPSKVGNCKASKIRYYFDQEQGKCAKFYYGGCQGNANRFLDIENCERTCVPKKETPIFTGDLCTLPKDTGSCDDYKIFWYFHQKEGRCGQFYYGGCEGNPNRFASREECEGRCVPTTTTLSTLSGEDAPDQCKQKKNSGSCVDYKPVWYFDHEYGACRRFLYGGCGGNNNRFNTRTECRDLCIYGIGAEKVRPTTATKPGVTTASSSRASSVVTTPRETRRTTTEKPQRSSTEKPQRSTTEKDQRSSTEKPQRSTTEKPRRTTTEKPRRTTMEISHTDTTVKITTTPVASTTSGPAIAKDRCLRPKRRGKCTKYNIRWHFVPERAECKRFWYGGCGSNGNNFDTKESCELQCKLQRAGSPVSSFPNTACSLPVHRGVCGAMLSRWYFDPLADTCKEFMFEGCLGNNNNFLSRKACLSACSSHQEVDICSLPRDVGPCKANKLHWYYNSNEGRCLQFTYGGCQGNYNNFETEEDCEAQCGIQTTVVTTKTRAVCSLPRESEPCLAEFLRYYYDQQTGECRPFSGCQVNNHGTNNFESQRECYELCTDFPAAYPILEPGDCYEPKDHGPCDNGEVRYFFNPSMGDCDMFTFGGCGGNGNNFRSYDDCLAYCSRVTWTCGVLQCDETCEHGFARGEDGCPYCECANACQGYECPDGYDCVLEDVVCVTAPCNPVPVCSPIPKEGQCPVLEADQSLCFYECDNDQNCPDKAKCCDTGCGKICASPGAPRLGDYDPNYYYTYEEEVEGDKPGQCPAPDDSYPGSCVDTCRRDSDCPDHDKCCSNGCGRECLSVLITAPQSSPSTVSTPSGCASSVFGCCPDGMTAAQGWNYIGCNEEAPVIKPATLTVVARVGDTVQLPCSATGAPTPQISWYRNRIPLQIDIREEPRLIQNNDGSLEISDITEEDDSQYSCRAYNSVGADTRTYTLIVHIPPSFLDTPTVIRSEEGGNAILECQAMGNPAPSIRWLKEGKMVVIDGSRITEDTENKLVIGQLGLGDAGQYQCEVNNGVGQHIHRGIVLHVKEKPLEVHINGGRDSYKEGDDVKLTCVTSATSNYTVAWFKDGMSLQTDDNSIGDIDTKSEVLFLSSLTAEDKGVYECFVERGTERAQAQTAIDLNSSVPSDCEDSPDLANCDLIVRFGYCGNTWYKEFCCKSCYEAGFTF